MSQEMKSEINQILKASDTPVYELNENASPTEKARSIGASIGLTGSSSIKAVVSDNAEEKVVDSEGVTTTVEKPEGNKPHLAVESAAEIPNWEKIGWKRVFEITDSNKSFQIEDVLKELQCNDLWLYSSVVITSTFATWLIASCGGSFGWILVLCAFIATYLKNSSRRFYRNARSDIGREVATKRLEDEEEKVEWLNEFLRRFWLIYEPVLSASVIQIADSVLVASTPNFLDSIRLTNFTLGSKPAVIESVKSYPKTDDNEVVMDWKISFVPNDLANMTKAQLANKVNPKVVLTIRVGRGFVGAGMPVLVENMSFTGLMRVKLKLIPTFPHVETIDLCFIEPPVINYVLKPIGGDTLGFDIGNIPGLSSFIREQVHATLRPMMYYPNVFTLIPEYLLYGYPIESAIGVLKLTIKSAKNLRNAERFGGTSDPYCKVMVQSSDVTIAEKEISRTKVINNSLNPVWNETYYLLLNNTKDILKFNIFDSNSKISADRLLGSTTFLLQSLVENPNHSNSTVQVLHEGNPKGELNFDAFWYPIAEVKENEPAPESNLGILKFNIHQAKDLDPRLSLVGVYNPYAEIILNGKLVYRTKTLRRINNPIWEEFYEMFITNRAGARLSVKIRDERDFAEDPVLGSWNMKVDEFLGVLNGETKNDWFNVKDASSGRIKLSCQWKPVILDHIPENVEPIGIVKLQIKKAKINKNAAQFTGKSDPYVSILLNTTYRGRTDIRSNNLNPTWDDEYYYVPVHSLEDKIYLQCFDHENNGKDRILGFTELMVKDLVKKSDDGKISPAESIDTSAPLISGIDSKGTLFYSASFHPVLHLIKEKGDVKEEKSENEFNALEHQSGILVVNINEAKFKTKKSRVEILINNDLFPVYKSAVSEMENPQWVEVTDVFIKELDFSKITFNIKHSGSKSSIGKVESNVKELLEKCLKDKENNVWLPIKGMDGCKLNVGLSYIPVRYHVELYESINNMGTLKINLVNAENLPAADRSGTSDPFVKFFLNDKVVFESKTLKKTVNPHYDENFSVSLFSQTSAKLFVKVYDWNKVESAKLIASGEIPLTNLSSTTSTQKVPLKNEINSTKTNSFITLSMLFHPEMLTKKKQKTGPTKTFSDLGSTVSGGVSTGVNGVGHIVGNSVGKVGGLLKKKDKDENKKSKKEKVIPREVSEVVIPEGSKLEKVVPEEGISKGVEPKAEVVHKPEEAKPVNEINGILDKQEVKEEPILPKPQTKDDSKQAKEIDEIKPYNVEFKKVDSKQEVVPKQEEEKESSRTSRHIEFVDQPTSRSVEVKNVKKDDEGFRSSEENAPIDKSKRISSYSINQGGEIIGEPGDLTIVVIEAKNVSDKGTTSDPYVKVKVNGKKEILKTSVIKKSISPKWNEQVTLTGLTGSPISFLFSVRDRNLLSKNVELGEYDLHLWDHINPDENIKDFWVNLSRGTNAQLHIKLDFSPSSKESRSSGSVGSNSSSGSSGSNGYTKHGKRTSVIF
ncbi:10929_t:CDS:10, partial [Funneliformis caledonium]